MRIEKWLCPSMSAVNGSALIRVEPGEIADIETFLTMIDGDSVGHFGLTATLVSTGEECPKLRPQKFGGKAIGIGYLEPEEQFGFPPTHQIRKEVRWYKVYVHRD